MATAEVRVKLKFEIDTPLRAFLEATGWTPPATVCAQDLACARNSDAPCRRPAPVGTADLGVVTVDHHNKALNAMEVDHRRHVEQVTNDLKAEHRRHVNALDAELRASCRRQLDNAHARAVVAERRRTRAAVVAEIAGRLNAMPASDHPGEINRVMAVARVREHAGGNPAVRPHPVDNPLEPIAFWPAASDYEPVLPEPVGCTLCQHPVPQHGPGGCWAARKGNHNQVCDCPATHGRTGPSPEAEDGDAPEADALLGLNESTRVFSLRLPPERILQLRRLATERYGKGFGVTLLARQILAAALDKAIQTGELAQE